MKEEQHYYNHDISFFFSLVKICQLRIKLVIGFTMLLEQFSQATTRYQIILPTFDQNLPMTCLKSRSSETMISYTMDIQTSLPHHPSTTTQFHLSVPKNNMNPHPFFLERFATSLCLTETWVPNNHCIGFVVSWPSVK